VIDVRSEAERAGGHIAGSLNIPLPHLEERSGEIPAGKPIAVHCEGGYRSAIAASLLQKLGRGGVHDLVGGYKAWAAAKLPVAAGQPARS
jgi:rhodanese-related sulfurtransferase